MLCFAMQRFAMQRFAMLCFATLRLACCALPRCALSCNALPCYALPCCALACCALTQCALPCCALPGCALSRCALPCCALPRCALPRCALPCCAATTLCHACAVLERQLTSCRPASPSLSSKSRLSSFSLPKGLPFGNITNTPASRAATPGPADDVRASGTIKGIPRSGDGSRRCSQGLEDLQEQLQGVLQEGNKMQVGVS